MNWILKKWRQYKLKRAMKRIHDKRLQAWRAQRLNGMAMRLMMDIVDADMIYDAENGLDYDLTDFIDPELEPEGGVA